VDRHRARLTGLLAAPAILLVLVACTSTPGAPVTTATTVPTTSDTRATPTPSGYPIAKKQSVQVERGQTGTVSMAVGDVLAVYRPNMGTRPSSEVLVLAEVTDSSLIYQAVSAGKATVATDDPPTQKCKTTPCPPSGAAPPVVTVDVAP
jgi:hypothetical protein